MADPILVVQDLHKSYGETRAVRGISFQVVRGEVFGLLGPNGAGKTTIISMITGLLKPSSGRITVDGLDLQNDTNAVKAKLGLVAQELALDVQSEDLTGEQRVLTVGGFAFAVFTPMFATMFAFFLVGFIAESILREKEGGSFRRLLAAPIHRGTVVTGKMLAFVGVVFLQMVLLFGIGYAVFDMPLGDSPVALLALTLALALAATGLGMLLGSVARTSKEAGSIGLVLGFVLFFASGSLGRISTSGETDLGFRSEGLRFYISQLTPHAHAFDGYLKLMLERDGLVDILPNIVALLGFAVVFFVVAMWRFRFD